MSMKAKWIALLVLILALLSGQALAAAGDANLGRDLYDQYEDNPSYACVAGDTLYLFGYNHVFTYRLGDADLTAIEYERDSTAENENRETARFFSDGEALYALYAIYSTKDDQYTLDRAELSQVTIEDGKVRFGEATPVNIDQLTTSYGDDNRYLVQINDAVCAGGKLLMYVYDENGQEKIYKLDLAGGEGEYMDLGLGSSEYISCITKYDAQLLIETYDYDARSCNFWIYDPASENLSSACPPIQMDEDGYGALNGLAYSTESGRVFFLYGGYLMAMENFDYANAQPVAELSTMYANGQSGLLLPGDYYVFSGYEGTMVRNTAPGALPETRLVVEIPGYSDATMDAYYAFGNAHPEAAVVFNSSYMDSNTLVERMMNRDDSVDIYLLNVSSQSYDALYNRGYMVELDDEALTSAVSEMYPAFQEPCMRDGKVVAVPVGLYGWAPGFNYEGFEKIGIPREQVPTSWKELIDLLPTLPEKLPEDGSVRVFQDYITQEDVRSELFSDILADWNTEQNARGEDQSYDDPELIALLDQVMQMDFSVFGLREADDEEPYAQMIEIPANAAETYTLFETNVGCTIDNFYSNAEPVALSVLPGEQGYLPMQLTVAFINPFSRNVALAQEFLATLLEHLEQYTQYNLSDKLNEPVRNVRQLEYVEEQQKTIDDYKAQLETAEAVDKPELEETIAEMESTLAEMEKYSWTISQEDIDWYRSHADEITALRYNFLDGVNSDEGGASLSDMAEQMFAGKMSVPDFMKELNRQVRMRAMEGN